MMNSVDKGMTIAICIFIIMFFGMFYVLFITDAYKNTPTNFTININTDNETKESILSIVDLQKRVLEFEQFKLNNTNYGNRSKCLVGFYNEEYINGTWINTTLNYYESEDCYIIKNE